ncbi:MAG: dihydrodipicolinate synthase family protein [Opitutaceae bacterium]|nr:dihydrodipicolinate synthase family protein [Opitutaceae bacterium]
MKTPFPREGILAALAIPTDVRGRVLKRALAAHLAWLRERGIHGVLGLGSTGEFPRFSVEERKAILETVAELAAPLPVIANISDIRPQAVAELGRFARRLGLPGVAVMPPSFYPVSAADQLAFFDYAADAADVPVMLYNFPELTTNRIGLETIASFADRHPMVAIKQSGAEFGYHTELLRLGAQKGFAVFSGADTRLPEVFKLGVAGCIGGLVNFVPEMMVEQFRVFRKGEAGELEPTASRMREVGASIDRLTFTLNVAAGMEARGLEVGAPKMVVSAASAKIYGEIVENLRAKFAAWGLAPAGPTASRTRRRAA